MRNFLCIGLILLALGGAQFSFALDPTFTPTFPTTNQAITITYDVTGTALASLDEAFIWVWIPGKNTNAKFNVNPATTAAAPAKFTKTIADGLTKFTIQFVPADFFTSDISTETKLGVLLKGPDWSNGQTSDYILDFWDGNYEIRLVEPLGNPAFVAAGQPLSIKASTPVPSTFVLYLNGVVVTTQLGVTSFEHQLILEAQGTLTLTATTGDQSDEVEIPFILAVNSPEEPRPAGIRPGINYHSDLTQATLCFWAPGKESVYLVGDMTQWEVTTPFLMNRDGEYFWIKVTGLTPQTKYRFRYLVNQTIWCADPFSDQILDPADVSIPSSSFEDIPPYPEEAMDSRWYYNRVSVLETGQTPYPWKVNNFQRPAKEDLVIYELLIRDFFGSGARNYASLYDTIPYLKRLGINAIELMPIMEFNGNESWGYNPTFMFAPDKTYGTKEQLKAVIDRCHENGIAVILDVALNHQDLPNPFVLLDFDFGVNQPMATNKWFNQTARHPFNVFFDMNHESPYTQAYVDSVTHYWIEQYKVDGFRFDLSKGFTQTNNPDNVASWSAYDASRIAILKRMADKIWEHSPDAYVILEHFAQNSEEVELAEYRADEGKGMMLWGNLNSAYRKNASGNYQSGDVSSIYYKNRGWQYSRLVGYAESHDEERLVYSNLTEGKSAGSYNIREAGTAVARAMATMVYFLTTPGPKMIWQFGELGIPTSINQCPGGNVSNDCRLAIKEPAWALRSRSSNADLLSLTSALLRLRSLAPVFRTGDALFSEGGAAVKQISLRNKPYTTQPSGVGELNSELVVNFDVVEKDAVVTFSHGGKWYEYFSGQEITIGDAKAMSMTLYPGEFRLFTDVIIPDRLVSSVEDPRMSEIEFWPNPVRSDLTYSGREKIEFIRFISMDGRVHVIPQKSENRWDCSQLVEGLYVLEWQLQGGHRKSTRIVIRD